MFISILFESVPYRRYVTYTTRRYRMLMNKKKIRANLRDVFRFLPRSYERYIALNRASDFFPNAMYSNIYDSRIGQHWRQRKPINANWINGPCFRLLYFFRTAVFPDNIRRPYAGATFVWPWSN